MAAAPIHARQIPEQVVPGKRLGRHIEHDPASRAYGIVVQPGVQLVRVKHRRHGAIFDQGNLGSCTGNACAGAINMDPLHVPHGHILHEPDAVQLYSKATELDDSPGAYPPDDTGSSGLAVAKAAQQAGYISAYQHAFNIDAALQALQAAPVITGVDWYEGFDNPNPHTGICSIAGQVRGGHELVLNEYVPQHTNTYLDDLVGGDNSWSAQWGLHGRFYWSVRTWGMLLHAEGDATVLLPKARP